MHCSLSQLTVVTRYWESHLTSSSGRNATYISKTTQNELISCIGELMMQSVVKCVKAARFFSVWLMKPQMQDGRRS